MKPKIPEPSAPAGDDPFAARVDSVLHRRPDVAEDRREDQTEEAGGDRHEAFAAEEAQKSGSLMPAQRYVRHRHQTGNDTGQHAHIDFRVDGDHRFGHHEIPYRTGQRRRTGVIFWTSLMPHQCEDQRQIIEDRPTRLRDEGYIQQVWLPKRSSNAATGSTAIGAATPYPVAERNLKYSSYSPYET